MSTTESQRFAFGDNTHGHHGCPALVAGIDPEGDVLPVAERYDMILQDETGEGDGTVSRERAEEAWDAAVTHHATMARDASGAPAGKVHQKAADLGREVASVVF